MSGMAFPIEIDTQEPDDATILVGRMNRRLILWLAAFVVVIPAGVAVGGLLGVGPATPCFIVRSMPPNVQA
jgi:hypothetical protein